jgi:hypothetical protein
MLLCQVVAFPKIRFEIVELFHFRPILLHGISVKVGIGFEILPLPFPHPGIVKVEIVTSRLALTEE